MRKVIISAMGMLALAGTLHSAMAADIAVKAPVYKAPPPVIDPWTWTGFYVGLNGGYSWGRSRTDVNYFNNVTGAAIPPPPGSITSANFNLNGGVFGGQAGYNWQNGNWVGGIEADIQWTGQKGSAFFLCAITTPGVLCVPGATAVPPGTTGTTLAFDQKLLWFGTLRGRVGALVTPNVLAYVTGGLAYGQVKTEGVLTGVTPAVVLASTAFSHSVTKAGWTIGAGLEGRLWGSNWTGKIEYLYVDLGTVSGTVINAPALIGANYSSRITDNIFRVGVNYHFYQPVVARF
jgi:outer membrane immunogenic protein